MRIFPQALVALLLLPSLAFAGLFHRQKLELDQEYFQPNENDDFAKFSQQIQKLQSLAAKGGTLHRGFHAKHHGCLHGELEVLPDRPAEIRYGIFATTRNYPVWVRFSNAQGVVQSDKKPDLRGFAIKVLDVPGDKILPEERSSKAQDFLMTNQSATFVPDAKGFMEFAVAGATGHMVRYFARHPIIAFKIIRETTRHLPSLLTEQYWSGGAFRLGARASKFTVKPCYKLERKYHRHASDTYLTDDLVATAAEQEICFDFYVQLQADPYKNPIENSSVEWKPSVAPELHVARLHLPPQTFNSPKQNEFCENLSFSPWHALPEHRPLGNINRARRAVYEASRAYRQDGRPAVEPDGSERFE